MKCHKRLIDETVPYCYRCRLKTAGIVAAGVGLLCMARVAGAAAIAKAILEGGPTDGDGNDES